MREQIAFWMPAADHRRLRLTSCVTALPQSEIIRQAIASHLADLEAADPALARVLAAA